MAGPFSSVPSAQADMYFESKGTRYEGRTEQIEKVKCGDEVCVIRDEKNPFNRKGTSINRSI